MKTKTAAEILKSQLRHFGLNPIEWTLVQQRAQQFLIVHRQESTFKFIGTTGMRNRKPQWQELLLESL